MKLPWILCLLVEKISFLCYNNIIKKSERGKKMHYTVAAKETWHEVKVIPEKGIINDKKEYFVKEKRYEVKVIPEEGSIPEDDLKKLNSYVSSFHLKGELNDKGEYVVYTKELFTEISLVETISVEFLNSSEGC